MKVCYPNILFYKLANGQRLLKEMEAANNDKRDFSSNYRIGSGSYRNVSTNVNVIVGENK